MSGNKQSSVRYKPGIEMHTQFALVLLDLNLSVDSDY